MLFIVYASTSTVLPLSRDNVSLWVYVTLDLGEVPSRTEDISALFKLSMLLFFKTFIYYNNEYVYNLLMIEDEIT